MNEYYFIQCRLGYTSLSSDHWITVYADTQDRAIRIYQCLVSRNWHHINSTPTWSKVFMKLVYPGGELGYTDTDLWVKLPEGF